MQCGNWDALQLYSCNRLAKVEINKHSQVAIDKKKMR